MVLWSQWRELQFPLAWNASQRVQRLNSNQELNIQNIRWMYLNFNCLISLPLASSKLILTIWRFVSLRSRKYFFFLSWFCIMLLDLQYSVSSEFCFGCFALFYCLGFFLFFFSLMIYQMFHFNLIHEKITKCRCFKDFVSNKQFFSQVYYLVLSLCYWDNFSLMQNILCISPLKNLSLLELLFPASE